MLSSCDHPAGGNDGAGGDPQYRQRCDRAAEGARRILDGDEPLSAPDLVVAEACNGAWKAVRKHLMTAVQADSVAGRLPRVFETLHPAEGLAHVAMQMAQILDHPVYACFYVALAEQRNATMITADRRLIARLRGTPWDGRVRALGEYGAAAP